MGGGGGGREKSAGLCNHLDEDRDYDDHYYEGHYYAGGGWPLKTIVMVMMEKLL